MLKCLLRLLFFCQVVKHVHFHIIPKPAPEQGLKIGWPQQQVTQDDLKNTLGRIKEKL